MQCLASRYSILLFKGNSQNTWTHSLILWFSYLNSRYINWLISTGCLQCNRDSPNYPGLVTGVMGSWRGCKASCSFIDSGGKTSGTLPGESRSPCPRSQDTTTSGTSSITCKFVALHEYLVINPKINSLSPQHSKNGLIIDLGIWYFTMWKLRWGQTQPIGNKYLIYVK